MIEDYTGYSSYAVAQLSARIRARQAYDAEYLANKTALIEKINRLNNQTYYKLQQKIDALGLNMSLDIDLHLLTINTSELLSCNTLAGGACAAGVSMRDKIAEMKRNMSAQYAEAMDDYSIAVNRVRLKGDEELKKAEGFYDETMANSVKAVTRANEVFAQINAMFNGNVSCQPHRTRLTSNTSETNCQVPLQASLLSTRLPSPRRHATGHLQGDRRRWHRKAS